jgi:hypothetical protein
MDSVDDHPFDRLVLKLILWAVIIPLKGISRHQYQIRLLRSEQRQQPITVALVDV